MSEKEEAEIKSRKLADYIQLVDRGILTKQQVAEHLTEDRYILFSAEEILKINNEDVEKSKNNKFSRFSSNAITDKN